MSKTVAEIEKELDSKIPRDAIAQRDGGAGKKLSYLETHYVIDRLNKVFGPLGWSSETLECKQVGTSLNSKGVEMPAYVARVRITTKIGLEDGGYKSVVREGIGYGVDKSQQNSHEMAAKEAESDALKRAAMKFGMSMGLALYDKSQENVEDAEETVSGRGTNAQKQPATGAGNTGRPASNQQASVGSTDGGKHGPAPTSGPNAPAGATAETNNRQELDMLINSQARVVISQRKKTKEDLQTHLANTYKVAPGKLIMDQVSKLNVSQASEFDKYLKGVIG